MSFAEKSLTMGRYFPVQLVVKKEAALSVNIDEQKKQKQKVYIFVYKIFSNNIFKSYTTITMWRCALAKWSHCKVASLFLIFNLLATNEIKTVFLSVLTILPSVIALTSQARSVLRPQAIFQRTDSKNSYYCIFTKRTY